MSPGKIASQAGHAYVDAVRAAGVSSPDSLQEYFAGDGNHGIKICLASPSLLRLEQAFDLAREAGLPCALITDLGYTLFEGMPTITALGIGPARSKDIRFITKRFSLLE